MRQFKKIALSVAGGLLALGTSLVGPSAPAQAAANPNPSRITDASWWLMEQFLMLRPGTRNDGIYADKPGYHNTRAANDPGDYSVTDAEDKGGPSDKAAAYDWGFPEAQRTPNPDYSNIARYSNRLLASGLDPNDPRLDGWREFFGQTDSDSDVEGYDFRYERAKSSDPSHLWHIHLSEDRDKVTGYDNKVALLSVLKGETVNQWRSTQLLVSTSNGGLFHTMRQRNGSWTGFGNVEAVTGANFTPVDTASAMALGEQHALVAGTDGELWHAIRRVDGTWTPFGNVEDFAGEIGTITRVAATDVGGSLHVVVISDTHSIHHTVRSPNGSWTPLLSVEDFAGQLSDLQDVAAAGFVNGELQVTVSTATGRLFHSLRQRNGAWTRWGDVEAVAGDPGTPNEVSASEVNGVFHLVANYGPAGVRHAVRNTDGSWTRLLNINDFNGGNPGHVLDVAAVGFTNGELQVVALSAGGPIWHAVRRADGSWTPWGDVKAFAGNPGSVLRVSLGAGWRS